MRYKFYAKDKDKVTTKREFCHLWMPRKARKALGITIRSDVHGYVDAENQEEAEKMAKGQIKRLFPPSDRDWETLF
jgi:hypothetical protein